MKEVFLHLDRLKSIYKEKNIKSFQKKNFSNSTSEKNNSNLNRHSLNHHINNNIYNNNYNITTPILRPSIINLNNSIKKKDFKQNFYLIEEGSESEDCYNEETKETIPSLIKVAKSIPDPNEIMILTDIKYFPREATPGLIITGIEEWVSDKHIKYFLQGVPTLVDLNKKKNYYNNNNYNDNYIDIISIKIFVEQKNRFAFVQLKSFSQMEAIGNFFMAPIKKLYPSLNSKKEKIEVFFAYNVLELTKNHWYGVILRNLPVNCNNKSLYNFTEQKVENGIKYCSNPVTIDNLCCALVVCKELGYAEKLCYDLNNSEINNKKIKAHLHPNTCKIRNEENYKNFDTFSKNGYQYNNKANESEKCLEYSKNFMEFFFPNYINSIFNNKNKKKEEENKQINSDKNKIINKNAKTIKENMEKETKKKKDMDLANSIFNLVKKSNSSSFSQKSANKYKTTKINNNTTTKIEKKNPNNILNINNNLQLNSNEIIQKSIGEISNSNKQNIEKKEENIQNNKQDKEIQIENKIINNKDENKEEKGEIIENKEKPEYNEKEIDYYTYNMGDINYYNEKEKEEQRKSYSKYKRNNRNSSYNNNYNSNYHKYNQNYKKYDDKKNSPYHHYPNSNYKSYKKYNYENSDKERDRDRGRKKDREWENVREKDRDRDKEYSNDSQNRRLERSRDKNIKENEIINKKMNKINHEYNKRNDKDHYLYERYKKYNNDNKYYNKNNTYKFFDKNKSYNKYYDKNYNNNFEKRKESWHSRSKNNNDKEKRDKYSN